MANLLVKVVFGIINTIYNLIFAPILSGILALIPSLDSVVNAMSYFITTSLSNFVAVANFLFIPQLAFTLLFDYFIIKYSIYLIRVSIKFIYNVYTTLKP